MGVNKPNGKTTKKSSAKGVSEARDAKPRAGQKKSPAVVAGSTMAVSYEVIAGRAYELYLERGGGHGRDFEDWLAAEQELQNLAI